MTETATATDDAELVAYLDGELSPADSVRIGQRLASDAVLAGRLRHLMRGGRPFQGSFAPLLDEAPTARLTTMLDAALARPARAPRRWPASIGARPAIVACIVALLVAGAGLDRLAFRLFAGGPTASTGGEDVDDWRDAVAQYLALYTADTLAMAPDGGAGADALSAIGDRIGLALTPARADLGGLAPKRADIYAYDGKPLALLAYLDPQSGPLALCIIEGGGGGEAQRVERRGGMTIVSWSAGRHSVMLIGRGAAARLRSLAATVAGRFGDAGPKAPRGTPG